MSSESIDGPIVRHLLRSRMISEAQFEAARAEQTRLLLAGGSAGLLDVLIQMGVLTNAILDNVKASLQAARKIDVDAIGSYKLVKKLGEGGMGSVYLAEDVEARRNVALKVLSKKFSEDTELIARFRRETKATGKLNHENIVAAYAAGEDNGFHYYAMEYFEGESLEQMLKRKKVLPWDRAINYTLQVARGLKHAHERAIIHRDIKPANIFITNDGVAKILDMGLSKNISDTKQSFNTVAGIALGTPHFISPEQAIDEYKIDGRTDIYSLGATLYNLVTGTTPFTGTSAAAVMLKHLNDQLPNPQDLCDGIPDGVVQVIQKMMTKEPADRYPDCNVLITDLELVLLGQKPENAEIGQARTSVKMRALRSRNKKRTGKSLPVPRTPFYASAAVPAVALIAIATWAYVGNRKSQPHSNPDEPGTTAITSVEPQSKATGSVEGITEVNEAWFKSVQALPVKDQVRRVLDVLKEHNPGFDGKEISSRLGSNAVEQLSISAHGITKLLPIRALNGLKSLTCAGSKDHAELSDISCLSGMGLTYLDVHNTSVSDLSVLNTLTNLSDLNIRATKVRNLAPLSGLPLRNLYIGNNKEISELPALSMNLNRLEMNDTSISDLSPLRDRAIVRLVIASTPVRDLSPLKKMPLADLVAHNTRIESLDALKGAPLVSLDIHDSPVTSLAPLDSAKLNRLEFQNTKVTDLKPLRTLPVKNIECSIVVKRDMPVLATMPGLDTINSIAADEFTLKAGRMVPTPNVDAPARWKNAIDLLPLIDVKKDRVAGRNWEAAPDSLTSDLSNSRYEIPYQPPDEYDLRVVFTRVERPEGPPAQSGGETAILLSKEGQPFMWGMGLVGNAWFGFQNIRTLDYNNATGIKMNGCLELNHRYTNTIVVRKNSVKAFLDGTLISEWKLEYGPLRMPSQYALRDPKAIGLCSNQTRTIFHSVAVLEVGGKGRFTRPADPAAIAAESIESPARWAKAVNLMPLIDPKHDTAAGDWRLEGNELVAETAALSKLELPFKPAGDYEFRVEFTTSAPSQINQYATRGGKSFSWTMGANNRWCALESIGGRVAGDNENKTSQNHKISEKTRHVSIIQVRQNNVRVYLDSKLMADVDPNAQPLGLPPIKGKSPWSQKDESRLALGALGAATRFHRIQVLESNSKGSFVRPNDPAAREAEKRRPPN